MHEEALMRDLHRKLIEIGRTERTERFSHVVLWVGALSHVPEGTLRARWAEIAEGTPAFGADLEIESSEDLDDPRATGVVLASVDLPPPEGDRDRSALAPDPRPRDGRDPSPGGTGRCA
jgi:hypothetical protein